MKSSSCHFTQHARTGLASAGPSRPTCPKGRVSSWSAIVQFRRRQRSPTIISLGIKRRLLPARRFLRVSRPRPPPAVGSAGNSSLELSADRHPTARRSSERTPTPRRCLASARRRLRTTHTTGVPIIPRRPSNFRRLRQTIDTRNGLPRSLPCTRQRRSAPAPRARRPGRPPLRSNLCRTDDERLRHSLGAPPRPLRIAIALGTIDTFVEASPPNG